MRDASRGGEAWRDSAYIYVCVCMCVCAQGCAGRGMKYYNTSLGNCAAPSSGVYQVSNTLIRKPPLCPSFPVAGVAGELYATSFPTPPPLSLHLATHSLASPYARLRRLPWRRFLRATRRKITGMFAEGKVEKWRVERNRSPGIC